MRRGTCWTPVRACIWLGFRPGVTPAYFRGLIERQDTAALLDCLHQIPIRPGEVYFIPAGTAHAMGSDSLVAELQEPVDITLRAEYIRPDGSRLPVESMYGPAGMDGLLDCFHFDCLPREELLARHRFRPAPGAEEPWRKRLITPEQTPRFYMDEVELRREAYGSALCVNRGFQVLLVLEGEAEFQWEGGSLRARRGEELFVPHGVASYQCTAEGTCRLLECGLPGA